MSGAGTGAVALVLFVALFAFFQVRATRPWRELHARHPGTGGPDARYGRQTVELRPTRGWGVVTLEDSIAADWGPSSLSMAVRGPLGFVQRPVRIPVSAITSCQRRAMSGSWTGVELWVADAEIGVGFPRYDEGTLLAWCRERGIRILDENAGGGPR